MADHREHIPAVAAYNVPVPEAGSYRLSAGAEDLVAGLLPEAVIEEPEPVNIDEHDSVSLEEGELLVEVAAVPGLGQLVDVCLAALLHDLALEGV